MTGKERIKCAIEFKTPDRLPLEYEAFGISDSTIIRWNQIGSGDRTKRETIDEWGCIWRRSEIKNMGQMKGHPLEDWEKINEFKFPDPDNPVFWEGMKEKSYILDTNKYIKTNIANVLLERLYSLRGFENVMLDLFLEKNKLEYLADRIVEYTIGIIKNIACLFPGIIDGIIFTDDWGTELAAFISIELFNEFFKPRYRKIFDACHNAGWHVWLHSCGQISKLIPSMIETGVNVFQLLQPRVLDIEEFGKIYAGKTCFSSCVDIQHTLPFKSALEIAEEAKLLLDYWATKQGGFIASDYGISECIGVSDDIKKIMFDAFCKYDPYLN